MNNSPLDARVALEVMGWKHFPERGDPCAQWEREKRKGWFPYAALGPDRFSTDIAAAWEVVERMKADGFRFQLSDQPEGEPGGAWFASFDHDEREIDENSCGDSAPHAICLAALRVAQAGAARTPSSPTPEER